MDGCKEEGDKKKRKRKVSFRRALARMRLIGSVQEVGGCQVFEG